MDVTSQLKAALVQKEKIELGRCFDPYNFSSRPTEVQEQVFKDVALYSQRYFVAGNQSGKSSSAARETAWMFCNSHPHFQKTSAHPLLILVIGQTHKIVKEELWEKKLKPLLKYANYHPRFGSEGIESLTNKDNGNTILFFSHKNSTECRKSIQSFVADYVWLDEMPSDYGIIQELQTRLQARSNSRLLATFTPLLTNIDIKNHIENGDSRYIKKYVMSTYDNPIYTEEQKEKMRAEDRLMSPAMRATRRFGQWYAGSNAVYDFSTIRDVEAPQNYDASTWRHMEVVDPAGTSKAGFTLWAEDPSTNIWYIIVAEYVKGQAASVLLRDFKIFTKSVSNVCRRIADPHESWFILEAGIQGVTYHSPSHKTSRKKELIKNSQEALYSINVVKIAPWCISLIDEFNACQWKDEDRAEIRNSQRYHLLDCFQYGIDCRPPPEKKKVTTSIYKQMHDKDQARRIIEFKRKQGAAKKLRSRMRRYG